MKKFIATSLVLAMGLGAAFAQEAGHIASLESSAGKISFGAWGRSTLNVGTETVNTQVTADETSLGKTAVKGWEDAVKAYVNAGGNATDDPATMIIPTVSAALSGGDAATQAAIAAQLGQAYAGYMGVQSLKAMEADDTDTENFVALAPDWSYGCRVGFWIIGRTNDEKFGFDFNLDSDARALLVNATGKNPADYGLMESGKAAVSIGDQAKMWAVIDEAPLVDFKVALGKMRENELVGCVGDFGQRESSAAKTEDDLFTRFNPYMGIFASASGKKGTALEGLYIAADMDACDLITDDGNYRADLYNVARKSQVGIGYTIPGLLQVKAQYWGDTIADNNSRYSTAKYSAARAAGFDGDDYYGRMEFGVKWLGFAGGATGLGDVDLSKCPNANVTEFGIKIPIVTDSELRQYDPEMFYNFYAVLGTMGVVQQGFILYKAHVWAGQGESNLTKYLPGSYSTMLSLSDPADIFMVGFDALTEVCVNPFGAQNLFVGLSGNWNMTSATADEFSALGSASKDLKLNQFNAGAEVYVKKTFAANNYLFAGVAYRYSNSVMEGEVGGIVDLKYDQKSHQVYMPIGIEMFF